MASKETNGDQVDGNTSTPESGSHQQSSTPAPAGSNESLMLNLLKVRKNLEEKLEESRMEQAKQEEDIINRAKQDEDALMIQLKAIGGDPASLESSLGRKRTHLQMLRHGSPSGPTAAADAWIFESFVESSSTSNLQAALLLMTSVSKDTKPFDGDPREWPMFIQSFKSMVHDVVHNDAQRVMLLREMLSSNLQHTFGHILSSPLTYQQALKDLWSWYGRPHMVLKAHMDDLRSLPTLKEDDHGALASFYQQIHGTATLLRTAGYGYEMKSSILLNQVVEKLPHHLATDWGHHIRKLLERHEGVLEPIPDLETFDEWLASRVMAVFGC